MAGMPWCRSARWSAAGSSIRSSLKVRVSVLSLLIRVKPGVWFVPVLGAGALVEIVRVLVEWGAPGNPAKLSASAADPADMATVTVAMSRRWSLPGR
jgi:hypothetical protein